MTAYYSQKAENALKRSEDLIGTNQTQIAFQELQAIVTNKRIKQWDERLEGVMKKYLELCVDLRKGQEAKVAIHQYRTLCGTSNIRSLDDVLVFFLDLAEKRAQKAQAESKNATLDLENDLDSEIPESVLMSELRGEDIKDRTDREIVTPWLKFLWETYRNVLDVLKSNAMLEARYHDAAQRAFKFCKQYNRTREFKGLSELLRTHLSNIQRYATSASTTPYHKITLSSTDTLQYYVDTRFKQLSTASYLELWQEAYRSVEDIHRLLALSKELPKPQLLINYYDHLTKIFWNSQNYVLHSYAYYKLFNLLQAQQGTKTRKTEENKGEEQSEPLDFKTIASSLLLSSISIPSTRTTHDEDIVDMDFGDIEKQQRLANLLDLSSLPDKNLLLSQVVTKRVTSLVHPELKDLYQILEVELNPLEICERMEKIFKFLETNPKLKVYIQPLKDVTLAKLITQLSRVYQSIRLSQVVSMASFMTLPEIERAFVQAVRQRRVLMTIDHQNDCITFGNNRNTSALDTDTVRTQLAILAKKLYLAQTLIRPLTVTAVAPQGPVLLSAAVSKKALEEEHQTLVNRKDLIEKKKLWEAENKKREQEAQKKLEEEEAKKREAEEQKLAEREAKDREAATQKRIEEEARQLQHKKIIENLTSTVVAPDVVQQVLVGATSVKEADVKKIVEDRQKELTTAKKEREKRLLNKINMLDVLERAKRTEEIPLIKANYETQKVNDLERYESQNKALQEQQRTKFDHEKKMKQQLSKMFKDRREFINSVVLEERRAQIDGLKKEHEEKKKRAKQAWEDKRAKIQKEIDRIKKEREEEDAKRQEILKIKREAEEKKRKEEEEEQRRKDKEEQERRNRLDKQAELRAQKEREIEQREAEKKRKLAEEREQELAKKREAIKPKEEAPAPVRNRWGVETEPVKRNTDQPPKTGGDSWRTPKSEPKPQPSEPLKDDGEWQTTGKPKTSGDSWRGSGRRFDDNKPSEGGRRFDDDRGDRRFDNRESGRRFDDRDSKPSEGRRFDDRPSEGGRRFDDRPSESRGRFDDRPSEGRGRFDDRDNKPSEGGRRFDDRPSEGRGRFDDKPSSGRSSGGRWDSGSRFSDRPSSGRGEKKEEPKPTSGRWK